VLDPAWNRLIAPLKQDDLEVSDWPVDVNLVEGGGPRHLALRLGINTGDVLPRRSAAMTNLPDLAIQAAIWNGALA